VRWPHGAAARSLIHERVIAAVAVSALTCSGQDPGLALVVSPWADTVTYSAGGCRHGVILAIDGVSATGEYVPDVSTSSNDGAVCAYRDV
jgi:hypothetical protein